MAKTKRHYSPSEKDNIIQEAEREGYSQTCRKFNLATYWLARRSILGIALLTFIFSSSSCTNHKKAHEDQHTDIPVSQLLPPVEPYIYEDSSSNKVTLDEFGEVFKEKMNYNVFDNIVQKEVYKVAETNEPIKGIERFGDFRIYSSISYDCSNCYRGSPKIEILRKNGEILKTIYWFQESVLFNEKIAKINPSRDNENNHFFIVADNLSRYVNPEKRDNFEDLNRNSNQPEMSLQLSYKIHNQAILLTLNYSFRMEDETLYSGFELIGYNNKGMHLGTHSGFEYLSSASITRDFEYVYLNFGGGKPSESDPYILPSIKIVNFSLNEVVLSKEATRYNECISAFTIKNSNKAGYSFSACKPYTISEIYIVDHDTKRIYPLHLNKNCSPPFAVKLSATHCSCYKKDKHESILYYENDISSSQAEFLL